MISAVKISVFYCCIINPSKFSSLKHEQFILLPFFGLKVQFLCSSLLAPFMQLHLGLDALEWPHLCVWGLGCDGWNVWKKWASLSTGSHILDFFSAWWSQARIPRGPEWELLGLLRHHLCYVLAKANQKASPDSRGGEIGSNSRWKE